MPYLVIRLLDEMLVSIRTSRNTICDFLTENGYSAKQAQRVADWALLANVGETYTLRGAKIKILAGCEPCKFARFPV